MVKCSTLDHIESYFRCIIADTELEALLAAMKAVSKSNNIDRIPRDVLKVTDAVLCCCVLCSLCVLEEGRGAGRVSAVIIQKAGDHADESWHRFLCAPLMFVLFA